MKPSTHGQGAVRTPATGAWHVKRVSFFAIHSRSNHSVRTLSGVLSLLLLAAVGCESQGVAGGALPGISTKRNAIVGDLVREGARLQEAELMAGSGAEEDLPLAVALETARLEREEMAREQLEEDALLDTDAGVDPFAEEASLGDDSVRCGDGELDEDELCDIAIAVGEEGACPTSCNAAPDCPEQTLILRTCWTRCAAEPAPDGC